MLRKTTLWDKLQVKLRCWSHSDKYGLSSQNPGVCTAAINISHAMRLQPSFFFLFHLSMALKLNIILQWKYTLMGQRKMKALGVGRETVWLSIDHALKMLIQYLPLCELCSIFVLEWGLLFFFFFFLCVEAGVWSKSSPGQVTCWCRSVNCAPLLMDLDSYCCCEWDWQSDLRILLN